MLPVVPGELQPVVSAIFRIGLAPALDHQFQEELKVVVTDAFPIAHGPRQAGEIGREVVSPTFAELHGQIVGPGHSARRDKVRLVAKRAGHALAELVADLALVGPEGDLQELLRHARINQIDIPLPAVPGRIGRGERQRQGTYRRAVFPRGGPGR